jgi:electron transport complex protein RnfE
MGLGFTIALTIIGLLRELLGAGTFFGISVLPDSIEPIAIFVKAPGAFMVIAIVIAVMNAAGMMTKANEKVEGCDGCCAACASSCSKEEKEEQ